MSSGYKMRRFFAAACLLFGAASLTSNAEPAEELPTLEDHFATPVSFANELTEAGVPFDPHAKRELEMIKAIGKAECASLSFNAMLECKTEIWRRFLDAGRLRGNIPFVERNYLSLGQNGINELLLTLREQFKKAKRYAGSPPRGELSRSQLDTEINELRRLRAATSAAELRALCENVFGEGHARCVIK